MSLDESILTRLFGEDDGGPTPVQLGTESSPWIRPASVTPTHRAERAELARIRRRHRALDALDRILRGDQ